MTTYGTIPTSSGGNAHIEYLSRAKERIKLGLSTRQSWKQLFDHRSIKLPASVGDAISRIKTNLAYFRVNYVMIILLILFLSLLWHPISLIVFVVLMAAWLFLYFLRDKPIVILHRTIDDRVVLVVLSALTVILLLFTGATVNIIVSISVGVALVVIHAALMKTDDLFVDEEAAESGGLLASPSSS